MTDKGKSQVEGSWMTYSQPYEENNEWFVDINNTDTDDETVECFDNKEDAEAWIRKAVLAESKERNAASEPTYNQVSEKWELYVFPPNVNDFYEVLEHKAEEDAIRYFENCDMLNASQQSIIKREVSGQEGFAEKMMKYGKGEEDMDAALANMNKDDDIDHQKILYAEKLKKVKLEFRKKKTVYEKKARNVLFECAKFYLGEDADNTYVKYKADISKMGLASLMFQMDTAEEVIYTMAAEIKLGNVWARNVEVLAQLQRVVLDIGKFQHEYLGNIEQSMRDLKEDLVISGKSNSPEEENVSYFNDNKKLLETINDFQSELQTYRLNDAKPSRNSRLRAEGEDIVDVEYEEKDDGVIASDLDEGMAENSGLESYDTEKDK